MAAWWKAAITDVLIKCLTLKGSLKKKKKKTQLTQSSQLIFSYESLSL